ncbi:MAG TPA: hypothetical protein VGO22_15450 [Pseudorhizobium sp.]|jgi:hypothetical protein|nr:hypothetical protein [Pseudorhizobium sp.]
MSMTDEDKNAAVARRLSSAAVTQRGSAVGNNGRLGNRTIGPMVPESGSAIKSRADLSENVRVGPEEESREAQIDEDDKNGTR